MTFVSPWWLFAAAPVLGAALWALYRPWRQIAVVGSLQLWQKAAAALGSPNRQRSRRVSLSWLCLLGGAIAAVLAAANPIHVGEAPARRVAVAPIPSSELAGDGGLENLRQAVSAFLDRLSPNDQVRLFAPLSLKDSGWITPSQAGTQLAQMKLLPIRAADILPHAQSEQAQHVYYFLPAGTPAPAGPDISTVEVASPRPPVTLQAVGGEETDNGRMQAFLSVSPNGNECIIHFDDGAVDAQGHPRNLALNVHADGLNRGVLDLQAAEAIAFSWPNQLGGAYLVRRPAQVRKVAILGADNPLIRRFVLVNPDLQLVASAEQADLVIANEIDPPAGKPALVIAPPTEPRGWRWGGTIQNLSFKELDVASTMEIMRDVHLEGVVARRVRTLIPGDQVTQKVLAAWKKEAVILQDDGEQGAPPRVYVSFALDARNTNFGLSTDFVVFLANVANYLAPSRQGQQRYEYQTPLQAGAHKDWVRTFGPPSPAGGGAELPWPGIYKDGDGKLHAINLLGLRSGTPKIKPVDAVAALPLPPPEQIRSPLVLWPMLLGAAVVLWLIGWGLR
jgi:hypothetical protein